MKYVPGTVKAKALLLAAALFAVVGSPLSAQEPAAPLAAGESKAAPVSTPAAPLPGPRVTPAWQRVEPSVSESRDPVVRQGSHTITITTLVLVLAVVILVLLIV